MCRRREGGGRLDGERHGPLPSLYFSLFLSNGRDVSLVQHRSLFPPPFWKNHFSSFSLPYFFSFPVHFFVPYLFLLFSSMLSFLLLCVLLFFFLPYVYVCVCSLALFVCSNAREEYFWVVVFFSCVPAHVLFPQASQFLSLFCHIRRFPECVFELFSFPFSLLHLCLPIGIPDSVVSIT